MKYIFEEDSVRYEFELNRITPSEFEKMRKNGSLIWDEGKYKLNEDIVAVETNREYLYNVVSPYP